MKYGGLWGALSLLLAYFAIARGGWSLAMLWPAASLALVSAGYLGAGPRVFGKSASGVLAPLHMIILAPYLAYMGLIWHASRAWRALRGEPPVNHLVDNLYIGRRLLSQERPDDIDHVIDLTSEFTEPRSLRSGSYRSFPILDAHVVPREVLSGWVNEAASLAGNIYIHCAEGHGRTGMFVAALLLRRKIVSTLDEALQTLRSARPKARLNRLQRAALRDYADFLDDSRQSLG